MIEPVRQLCEWLEPKYVANELIKEEGDAGFIWLDGDGSNLGRWVTIAASPIDQVYCRGLPLEKCISNPFEILRNLDSGHWTGWVSYEAGAWIEPSNPWKLDSMATLWMACHDPVLKFDLKKHELWIEGSQYNKIQKVANWLKSIQRPRNNLNDKMIDKYIKIPINSWQWITEEEIFKKNVDIIKELISNGDIFQANLSTCCTTSIPASIRGIDIFSRLRKFCPAPFSAFVSGAGEAKGEAIISSSPERFLKIRPNGEVETRPIKGTRPRNSNPYEDANLAIDLVSSQKDRAENIMIVDLLRNDLGKVCEPGSIKVTQLVGLESFKRVHHLTSVIEGSLIPQKNWVDVFEACWPGGSISVAPKIRACQRLNQLEPIARGPYCGSLLHLDWDGTLDSNILIRSLLLHDSSLRAHAGCGIVADSDPIQETEELKWKLIPLLKALDNNAI